MIKVTAAIIRSETKVLIAKRPLGDRLENLWEFPGGKIEPGESPEQCLKRELQEELSINAEIGAHLISNNHVYDHCKICLMAYEVRLIKGNPTPTFHDDIRWVSVDHLNHYEFAPADIPIVSYLIDKN
jgi:8-oxo-dGTP diphosphatase